MFGNPQLKIHYEDSYLRVFTNSSGDLFVEDTRSHVAMRINRPNLGGLEFTTSGRVEPILVNNMIAWRIKSR
jgi:hypothetical protein